MAPPITNRMMSRAEKLGFLHEINQRLFPNQGGTSPGGNIPPGQGSPGMGPNGKNYIFFE